MNGQAIRQPRAYLFRSAFNLALTYRHRRADRMLPTEETALQASIPRAEDTADLVIERQEAEALHEAIGVLPPGCRKVLILRSFEGLTHAEISEELGISQSAVEKQVSRAICLLRKRLRRTLK
jgi:RNA polymerase sigma-70 factor (ECF subfamily)